MIIKKAQSSLELIIIISAMLGFFTTFFILIQQQSVDKIIENRQRRFQEVLINVQNEIFLASSSVDGYSREFLIPEEVSSLNYDIMIIGKTVYLETEGLEHAMSQPILEVWGDLKKGNNTIEKINNVIYINRV